MLLYYKQRTQTCLQLKRLNPLSSALHPPQEWKAPQRIECWAFPRPLMFQRLSVWVYQCFGPQIIVTMSALFLYDIHFFDFLIYFIQHCFICRPQIVLCRKRLGFKSWNVATLALTIRSSNLSARAHPLRISQPKCVLSFSEIFLGTLFSLGYNVCTSPCMLFTEYLMLFHKEN
jgi:hypothetical protein